MPISAWQSFALRGAIAVFVGLVALLWPGITLALLILLFGVYALLDGILAIAVGAGNFRPARAWMVLIEGFFGITLGLAALAWSRTAPEILVVAIGLWAIATGILELAAARRLRNDFAEEAVLGLAGATSLLLGFAIFFWPTTATITLVLLLGGYAVTFGASMIVTSVRLRRYHARDSASS
jgi:uncharacterized membrane protein HdeD (DUF308 family)